MEKLKKVIKRILLLLVCLIALALLLLIAGNVYVRLSVKNRIIELEEAKTLLDVDCILVLGASVKDNAQPSIMLEDRLITGIALYEAGVSPRLLMSGDNIDIYYDEVTVMKNYAKEHGVPSEDIFLDHAGLSTYESMYRAKHVFHADRVVIVTQRYHMYRALYDAKRLGLDAYGVAAKDIRYKGQLWRDMREYLATVKDFVKTIFKPASTVVGDPIPLNGNGDVTD